MKSENCKLGMKIERFRDDYRNVKRGSIYTVTAINFEGEGVRLEETNDNYWYDLSLFRPVELNNKFEVGDEVNYKINCAKGNGFKGEIFGVEKKNNKPIYAVKSKFKNGDEFVVFASEKELSPLKKKDELEVGDKFIFGNDEIKVEGVSYDEFEELQVYLGKRISDGMVFKFREHEIDEIIYD